VLAPRYRWAFPEPLELDPRVLEIGHRLGLDGRTVGLLARRGVVDAAEIERFFGPPEAALHDPGLLPDAAVFLDRIRWAIGRGERILVFGDFDADGLTGLAILVRALRALGADVLPYVPSRLEEGHGLSIAAIETATTAEARLIVTVDCGSTSGAEIEVARGRGLDVLVTDHHRVPEAMPAAIALVNPHRPDSRYPDRRLAGSGVAFKLAQLLLADRPDGPAAALGLADLAMIGTVADVAPILGENRGIARLGLAQLHEAPRPGIAALLAGAGLAAPAVDLETIAFAIAPRLNAASRVGEAFDAARLLLTDDPAEATELAATLESANATRRDLMRGAVAEARTSADAVDDAPAIIVRGPWPVGIVGLVAGRLAEERGRPAIVGADLGSIVRASCRGDGHLHLADAVAACGDLLLRHGGHAGAAGFEIPTDRWEAFRTRFLDLAEAAGPVDPQPELPIDLALPARAVDYGLHRALGRLAPAGTGNPDPLVAVLGLQVMRAREASGGHTQLVLRRELDVLDGIAFGWPELAAAVAEGDRIDVVARLTSRRFGGIESLQLEIRDAASSGHHGQALAILDAARAGSAGSVTGVLAPAGDASR
jgi:single-stranded-DNA-specific exonuclease